MGGEAPIYTCSSEDAAHSLCGELLDVFSRWIHIGVILGVEFSWLEGRIGKDTDQQNLRDTIKHWLNSLGDVTLQRLVGAVEHGAGGNNPQLAEVLREKLTTCVAN